MKEMYLSVVLLVATCLGGVVCDYSCLCNYNVEISVVAEDLTTVIGYLYEFDCKAIVQDKTIDDYTAIAYEHQVGYIKKNNNAQEQTCQGTLPSEDIVTTGKPTDIMKTTPIVTQTTTTKPTTTTTQTTTMKPTTTTQTKTTKPTSTTQTTTMKPTTTTQTTTIKPTTTTQTTTTKPTTTTQTTTMKPTTTTQTTTTKPTTTMQTTTTKPTTTTQTTTSKPTSTTQTTTTKPTSTTQSTTTKPTTTTQTTTIKPPTTTQTTTIKPTTTTQTPTTKPTTTMQTTTLRPTTSTTQTTTTKPTTTKQTTTMKPSTTKRTIAPVPVVNHGLCPQVVQEHAKDDKNIIAVYGRTCYELIAHRYASWDYAESDCRSRGGDLLNIASAGEQHFISQLLDSHSFRHIVWIGLNDRYNEEHFEWVSGNNITFMNWLPGRKDTFYHNYEDCVFMSPSHNWQWDDDVCGSALSSTHNFMCQYRTVDANSIVTTTPSPSSDGNTNLCTQHHQNHAVQYGGVLGQYGHSCYELLPHYGYTWRHAEQICNQHGGHLAHISNPAEQSFIEGFMLRHAPRSAVWIGLHDLRSENYFEWTSGNQVTYYNWLPGHVSNFVSHHYEDCVAFIPYMGGKWDDIQCGYEPNGVGNAGETHIVLCQFSTATGAIVG